jgi:hypothetical protein
MVSKKDFEGVVNARLIQSEPQAQDRFQNPARAILLLRAVWVPETFSTASTLPGRRVR